MNDIFFYSQINSLSQHEMKCHLFCNNSFLSQLELKGHLWSLVENPFSLKSSNGLLFLLRSSSTSAHKLDSKIAPFGILLACSNHIWVDYIFLSWPWSRKVLYLYSSYGSNSWQYLEAHKAAKASFKMRGKGVILKELALRFTLWGTEVVLEERKSHSLLTCTDERLNSSDMCAQWLFW